MPEYSGMIRILPEAMRKSCVCPIGTPCLFKQPLLCFRAFEELCLLSWCLCQPLSKQKQVCGCAIHGPCRIHAEVHLILPPKSFSVIRITLRLVIKESVHIHPKGTDRGMRHTQRQKNMFFDIILIALAAGFLHDQRCKCRAVIGIGADGSRRIDLLGLVRR